MEDFAAIGWGPVENTRHDLGTDLYIQVRDQRRFDLGLVVGAQVKAGSSYFDEPTKATAETQGWWFRDSDRSHVDSWLAHALPHLLILRDVDAKISYWAHVTEESVISTGQGAKILVPRANVVDAAHAEELLKIAGTGRPPASWERSAWAAGDDLLPGDLLRHALVVPRLVAPHPNASRDSGLSPEQAVALVMQARFAEYHEFSKAEHSVPNLRDALTHSSWTWRFVGALAARVSGDVEPLLQVVKDAPDPATLAASSVATVCGLLDCDRVEEALALLDRVIGRDDQSPVDDAWLRMQRARVHAEIGQVDKARADAASIPAIRIGSPSDATASAVAAAATALLFSTADWGQHDLEEAIKGRDTAASWWRAQNTSRGLGAVVTRTFKSWAQDQAVTWSAEDVAAKELYAASLAASHAGDHGSWCYLAALNAQDALLRVTRGTDPADVIYGLELLRRSGDTKALKLAVDHVAADGPSAAVTALAARMNLDQATRTTGLADLRLLERGGDLLDGSTADRAARWLLATLESPDAYARRTTPAYGLTEQLLKSLAAALPAASAEVSTAAAGYVLDQPAVEGQVLAQAWAGVVFAITGSAWEGTRAQAARERAGLHHDSLRLALLCVASRNDATAREVLVEETKSGSTEALSMLGSVRDLPDDVVRTSIEALATAVVASIEHARVGTWGMGAEAAGNLVILNASHPTIARWEPVVDLLQEGQAATGAKRSALSRLSMVIDEIPADVRARLRPVIRGIAAGEISSVALPLDPPGDARGEATHLGVALGSVDDAEFDEYVTRLLHGSPRDRRWAAHAARRRRSPQDVGILVALSSDPSGDARAAAAAGLADLVCSDLGGTGAEYALRTCLADPGCRVAMAVSAVVRQRDGAVAEAIRGALAAHPSARVRDGMASS